MKHFVGILFLFAMLVTLQCQTKRGANAPTHPNMQPSGANAGDLSTPDGQAQAIMTASQIAAGSSDCMNEYSASSHATDYTPTQAVCQVASQLATNTDLATSVVTQATETSSDGTKNIDTMEQIVQASATRTSTQTWTGVQIGGAVVLLFGALAVGGGTLAYFKADRTEGQKEPVPQYSVEFKELSTLLRGKLKGREGVRKLARTPNTENYPGEEMKGENVFEDTVMKRDGKHYAWEVLGHLRGALFGNDKMEYRAFNAKETEKLGNDRTESVNDVFDFSEIFSEKTTDNERNDLKELLLPLENYNRFGMFWDEYKYAEKSFKKEQKAYQSNESKAQRAKISEARSNTKKYSFATILLGGLVAAIGGYTAFGLADSTQAPNAITTYIESLGQVALAMKP